MCIDLFEEETAILQRATNVVSSPSTSNEEYRHAMTDLVQGYERLMRQSRRLITRSDRKERELNLLNAKLQKLSQELDFKARHDHLTGVYNRGTILEKAHHYQERAPLSLIILDIDLFKQINDGFGHPAGDAVICELVQRIKKALNNRGEIGRIGGEEFMILFSDVPVSDVVDIAEELRTAIAESLFPCLTAHPVTASFGVSCGPAHGIFEDVYARADEALYTAKRNGRNCVKHKEYAM